jgi:UDP-N-acetylmuramoylalanine--D-glutamate ligase
VGQVSAEATIVCEASSFQLEDTEFFSPEAAVLLNLAPDHLDRHPSYEDYVSAKLRVFAHQGNDDIAVAPADLPVEDLGGCARRVTFGEAPGSELSARAGYLWWDERPLLATDEISLPGAHNLQNAMAVAAVCLARGLEPDGVASGLRTFPGVAHRLERIATLDGVAFVNDSKATNVASTIVALRSYVDGVHLIAGGRGKQQDFSPLAPVVAERCRAVYLIGEAADEIAGALRDTHVELLGCHDLKRAVAAARARAAAGETVLLSPACASFDQYPNFEARGDHFRALVEIARAAVTKSVDTTSGTTISGIVRCRLISLAGDDLVAFSGCFPDCKLIWMSSRIFRSLIMLLYGTPCKKNRQSFCAKASAGRIH